jgi:hypothetical protein
MLPSGLMVIGCTVAGEAIGRAATESKIASASRIAEVFLKLPSPYCKNHSCFDLRFLGKSVVECEHIHISNDLRTNLNQNTAIQLLSSISRIYSGMM